MPEEERPGWLGWLGKRFRDGGTVVVGTVAVFSTMLLIAEDSRMVGSWFQRLAGTAGLQASIDGLRISVDALVDRMDAIDEQRRVDRSPIVEFEGGSISNGPIGGRVRVTLQIVKLRDCGDPEIAALFQNGQDDHHRFTNLTITDSVGRASAIRADPTRAVTYSFSATIPADDAVEPGRAEGWFVPTYSDCPDAPRVESPRMPFMILEAVAPDP